MFNDEKKNKSKSSHHNDFQKNDPNFFSDIKNNNCPCDVDCKDCNCKSEKSVNVSEKNNCKSCHQEPHLSNKKKDIKNNTCPCDDADDCKDCNCQSKKSVNVSDKNNCKSCHQEPHLSNKQQKDIKNNDCPCDDAECKEKATTDNVEDDNDISQLKIKITKLQNDFNNLNQLFENEKLKHQADLENFTKRVNKERINERKYASFSVIENLLTPYEQFEKVLEMPVKDELLKKFLVGFKMIQQQIKNIFIQEGLKEIKALEEVFDPRYHYAMEKVSDKNKPNNINISVLQKGYLYKDRVLKPAMVKVNEWSDTNEKDK